MNKFSVVKAKGSHYEVGRIIGKQLKSAITKLLTTNKQIFKKDFLIYLNRSKQFLIQAEKFFPQYVDELRGMSDGAQVQFTEVFLSNNREVANFDPMVLSPNHCTIVGIPNKKGYVLGHNEDWEQKTAYIAYGQPTPDSYYKITYQHEHS